MGENERFEIRSRTLYDEMADGENVPRFNRPLRNLLMRHFLVQLSSSSYRRGLALPLSKCGCGWWIVFRGRPRRLFSEASHSGRKKATFRDSLSPFEGRMHCQNSRLTSFDFDAQAPEATDHSNRRTFFIPVVRNVFVCALIQHSIFL